jgi:hypothetical protein
MADSKFVETPMEPIAKAPAGYKGGPGVYDGEKNLPAGMPGRTHSPNGVPEKVRDGSVPSVDKNVILPDKMPKHFGS